MTQPDIARLEVSARDQQIEAICQARCLQPGLHWSDGMTEGVARIEKMLAERCLDALALPALLARVRELELIRTRTEQFLAKIDEVTPHIDDAFLYRFLRCGQYTGPNYGDELDSLRAALTLNRSETDAG